MKEIALFVVLSIVGLALIWVGDHTMGDPIPWYLFGAALFGAALRHLIEEVLRGVGHRPRVGTQDRTA